MKKNRFILNSLRDGVTTPHLFIVFGFISALQIVFTTFIFTLSFPLCARAPTRVPLERESLRRPCATEIDSTNKPSNFFLENGCFQRQILRVPLEFKIDEKLV